MSLRKVIVCSCATLAIMAAPAFARIDFDIDIGVAPPPAQVEVVPAVPPGYVWVPGYWAWEDGRHVWVPGRRIEERPGYNWVGEHWEKRGDKWHFERGYWEHKEHAEHGHDEHEHDHH